MMKKKIESCFIISLLLFGMAFVFNSCERDDNYILEHTIENEKPPYIIKKIGLKKIQKNNKLIATLDKITKNNTKFNLRNDESSTGVFTINTDMVTYIESLDQTYHSYTFSITRDQNNGLLENLLISLQNNGSYKAFIITYAISEQEKTAIANSLEVDLENKVSYYQIEDYDIDFITTSRPMDCGVQIDFVCWQTQTCNYDGYCTISDHHETICDYVFTFNNDCDPGYGGNNTNTGGEGTGTQTGSGGTGGTPNGTNNTPTNNNVSAPTIDEPMSFEELEAFSRSCNDLSNLSASPDFITRMNEIKEEAINGNTEISYYGNKNTTTNQTSFPNDSQHRFQGLPNKVEVLINIPTNTIDSYIHNHFIANTAVSCLSVFSSDDLFAIFKLYAEGKINNLTNFTAVVVTPKNGGTVYAITISDTALFQTAASLFSINKDFIKRRYNKQTKINENYGNLKNEKELVRFLKKQQLGITLYRGDINDFNSWTKLKAKTDGRIQENLCNQ